MHGTYSIYSHNHVHSYPYVSSAIEALSIGVWEFMRIFVVYSSNRFMSY